MNKELLKEYKVPFLNKAGELDFPIQALNGIVFLWPKPLQEKQGLIIIPDFAQYNTKSFLGIVLSAGKGCKEKKTGKFTKSELNPGDKVIYDKEVPWRLDVKDKAGKLWEVEYMNMFDISCKVED